MIDWAFVAVHGLWILGLSIVLAAFSYHDWLRQERGVPLRVQLREPGWRLPLYSGLLLVASAFVLMRGRALWERALWAALGSSFAWDALAAWRETRARRGGQSS
jgi:hypothetical protein